MKIRLAALAFISVVSSAQAAERPTITLMVENDSFIHGIDRHYTSGLYGSWTSATQEKDAIASFAEHFMLPGDGAWRHGYFLGQSIFTPENLSAVNPPLTDRPYAGWLFGGARLYRDSGTVLDRAELTLGLVGPASLGGDIQRWWHGIGIFGGAKPRGWHSQLPNEPGLVLSQQRIWRINLANGPLEVEILPQAHLSLGNIFTHAGAGGMLRFGSGLKSDWGPPRIAPGLQGADFQNVDRFAWYAFAGVEGRAVGRNIFLDGSSFQSSRGVRKYNLVGDFSAGVALLFPNFRAAGSYVRRSREFKTQRGEDEMASITVSFAP